MSIRYFFLPIHSPGVFKLFLAILPITSILFFFINPGRLDASDFMLIAWNPGQELLTTGSVYLDYPYPLWTVIVMLLFVVWTPETSMVLWFICNLLMLGASLALFVKIFDWKISPALFALVISLSVFFLPVLTSMWLGQLTVFSLLMLALTVDLFLRQQWTWMGIVLGLSFIKPQVMILLTGLLLLWSLWQRRWQVWLGFGAVIFVLTLISLPFISSPGQIIGGGIGSHLGTYIQRTSTIWGLSLSLNIPWLLPLVISLGLMIWLGWIWLPVLRGAETTSNRVLFLFSAATMVNLIAVPYSWMHNLALLLLPCGYCLTLALKVRGSARYAWLTLLFVIMHPLMVGLFIMFNGPSLTQAYQIVPALALLPMLILLEFQTGSWRI
jgi:hypothetical protein